MSEVPGDGIITLFDAGRKSSLIFFAIRHLDWAALRMQCFETCTALC